MRSLIENMMIRGKDYRAELDVFDSSFTGAVPQADFRDCLQGIYNSFNTTFEYMLPYFT